MRAGSDEIKTRLATVDDAAAIAAIYNQGIEDRIATFETEPRTPDQIAKQLSEKGDRFPTVVAERLGEVIAWASAGAYRSRPAYASVAEHSVYVARSARGKGAGRVALDALLAIAENRRGLAVFAPVAPGHRRLSWFRAAGSRSGRCRPPIVRPVAQALLKIIEKCARGNSAANRHRKDDP